MHTTSTRLTLCCLLVFSIPLSACREMNTVSTSPNSTGATTDGGSSALSSGFMVVRLVKISEDSSLLSWYDSDTSKTSYFVERQDADTSQFVTLAVLSPWVRAYLDGGRKQILHRYWYRISAVKGASEKQYSNRVELYLNPRRPLSVRPIHESKSSATLQWNFTGNLCEGFLVQRSLNGIEYTTLGTTAENSLEYMDDGLDTANTYYYRVFTLTKYDMGPPSLPIKIGYIFNPMYQQPIWMQVLFGN